MGTPEKQEENRDLDKTLERITSENGMNLDDSKKKGMKQALASIADGLPGNKLVNGKDVPTTQELQSAMTQRIEKDTSAPDVANNPKVQEIKQEMLRRISSQSNPAQLLKEYAEMRGMLDGAVGAVEGSQAQGTEKLRDKQSEQQKQNELANLSFVELGKKFRDTIAEVQKQAIQKNMEAANSAQKAGNGEATWAQESAKNLLKEGDTAFA